LQISIPKTARRGDFSSTAAAIFIDFAQMRDLIMGSAGKKRAPPLR